MKIPNPIASSVRRNNGWVIAWSRSTRVTTAPAANAPRITSRPSVPASATNAHISTIEPRIRIYAVVSWSRTSSWEIRVERTAAAQDRIRDHGEQQEAGQEDDRGAGPALAGEEAREQEDRREVGDRGARDHELSELRRHLAGVLEDGDDHPERGRGEDDRVVDLDPAKHRGAKSTTEGSRTRGASPSRNGAANAAATTISRLVKWISLIAPPSCGRRS
jgi:hypothetical protein